MRKIELVNTTNMLILSRSCQQKVAVTSLTVERSDEFTLIVQKLNIRQIYICIALQDLVADYLRALDYYLLRKSFGDDAQASIDAMLAQNYSPDGIRPKDHKGVKSSSVKGKVNRYLYAEHLKMSVSNLSNGELYSVRMVVSRSNLRIDLIQTDDTAASNHILSS